MRRGLGLGFLGAFFFSFRKALFVSILSCGRIGLMLSTERLAYPDVSILNMGEMTALSLGQDDNSSGPNWSQRFEAGETVLGSLVFRDQIPSPQASGCV